MVEWPPLPPSSRGLGRGPLKAETGVRTPVGAPAAFRNNHRHAIVAAVVFLFQFSGYTVVQLCCLQTVFYASESTVCTDRRGTGILALTIRKMKSL